MALKLLLINQIIHSNKTSSMYTFIFSTPFLTPFIPKTTPIYTTLWYFSIISNIQKALRNLHFPRLYHTSLYWFNKSLRNVNLKKFKNKKHLTFLWKVCYNSTCRVAKRCKSRLWICTFFVYNSVLKYIWLTAKNTGYGSFP